MYTGANCAYTVRKPSGADSTGGPAVTMVFRKGGCPHHASAAARFHTVKGAVPASTWLLGLQRRADRERHAALEDAAQMEDEALRRHAVAAEHSSTDGVRAALLSQLRGLGRVRGARSAGQALQLLVPLLATQARLSGLLGALQQQLEQRLSPKAQFRALARLQGDSRAAAARIRTLAARARAAAAAPPLPRLVAAAAEERERLEAVERELGSLERILAHTDDAPRAGAALRVFEKQEAGRMALLRIESPAKHLGALLNIARAQAMTERELRRAATAVYGVRATLGAAAAAAAVAAAHQPSRSKERAAQGRTAAARDAAQQQQQQQQQPPQAPSLDLLPEGAPRLGQQPELLPETPQVTRPSGSRGEGREGGARAVSAGPSSLRRGGTVADGVRVGGGGSGGDSGSGDGRGSGPVPGHTFALLCLVVLLGGAAFKDIADKRDYSQTRAMILAEQRSREGGGSPAAAAAAAAAAGGGEREASETSELKAVLPLESGRINMKHQQSDSNPFASAGGGSETMSFRA